MLLQTTKRSPCGHRVVRVSLEDSWAEWQVSCYDHGKHVSTHFYEDELEARKAADKAVLQPVTNLTELSLVPKH